MIPGKRFTFDDGKDYILPPLSFQQVEDLDEAGISKRLFDKDNPENSGRAALELIHRALVGNYPQMVLADLKTLLDPGLVKALLVTLLGEMRLEDRVTEGKALGQ